MAELSGHIAVVTGASGALGAWVTKAFFAAGANVVGIGRSPAGGSSDIDFIAGDLTSAIGAAEAIDAAHAVHGRIDSLVHLVGGFAGGTDLAGTPPATFDAMFDINLRSAFHVIRAVLPGMRAAARGHIVLTASRAAVEPAPGASLYAASKAALISLARSVAAEESEHGITVNAVAPGTMDTPKNREAMPGADYSKWAQPQHVASLIVYLTSPAASSITGTAIPVLGREA